MTEITYEYMSHEDVILHSDELIESYKASGDYVDHEISFGEVAGFLTIKYKQDDIRD